MNLPKDPVMLLSVVNTYLRDYHASLEELCDAAAIPAEELVQKLAAIDYHYDPAQNQFC